MRIPSKRKRECVFPASMQKLPGPGTRAILGPTKPCHEQSTQQEQGILKLRLIPSIALMPFLQQIQLHR